MGLMTRYAARTGVAALKQRMLTGPAKLCLFWGMIACLAVPLSGTARSQATADGNQAVAADKFEHIGTVVRKARIAQRDCDVVAKRLAVGRIQTVNYRLGVSLQRLFGGIGKEVRALRRDGVALDGLERAATAIDAVIIVDAAAEETADAALKKRLTVLRWLYADFDELGNYRDTLIRILSRLDGAEGDCKNNQSLATASSARAACDPEKFAPCRQGGPIVAAPQPTRVLLPIQIEKREP